MDAIDHKYDAMEDFELIDKLSEIANVKVPNAIEEIRNAEIRHNNLDDKNISRAHPGCRQKLRHGLSRLGAHGLRQSHFNSLPARVSQHTGRFSLL